MKGRRTAKLWLSICLIVGITIRPAALLQVRADNNVLTTVQGTVMSGTTSELLKLSTKEGRMEIKLDSTTDASGCKVLLPDKKIYVSVSYGSDGYLHAVKISGDSLDPAAQVDSATTVTVSGTIGDKSTNSLLYFKTDQGEMQIKLDTTTSLVGCSLLVPGETYFITCARGSDAYLHAISISDTATPVASTPGAVTPGVAAASVTGTVSGSTKENILYLSTKGGEMQFKIDSTTDTSKGMVHTPGNKLTVYYNHGSDAFLHAVSIVGVKYSQPAVNVDTSAQMTVKGTVGSKSNENMLYLDTKGGKMEIKLDTINAANSCKVLVSGKEVTVNCARGSDAYLHAVTVSGTSAVSAPAGNNVATASVTGTVSDRTKESVLYLSTDGGEMQFKIDSNADTGKGMIMTSGRQVTVSYYHGSDAWLHAVGIVGSKEIPAAVDIDTSSRITVEGTVRSNSNENMLYLHTSGGNMDLKLDAVSSLNNCKILVAGKEVTVSCARGSDAYWHAIDITGK